MKAKNRLRGFLCLNFVFRKGLISFLVLLSNSCFNRQAFAQSRLEIAGTVISALDQQPLKGATIKIEDLPLTQIMK